MKTRMLKKAQAAMEFLVTYGWAFVVVLVMVGALSYFGVLDPSSMTQDRANLGASGIFVEDMIVQSDGVTLMLRNAAGKTLYDLKVGMQHCSKDENVYSYSPSVPTLAADSVIAVKLGCHESAGYQYAYDKGTKVNTVLRLSMKVLPDGLTHIYNGEIKFNVRTDLTSDGV